jgi:hypothetical protein
MNLKTKISEYYIFPILTYCSFSIFTYLFLYQLGIVDHLPSELTLSSGDSGFYHSIMKNGYQVSGKFSKNPGFFPLFPYVWRLTHLGILGISLFNVFLFLISLGWLCKILKPEKIVLLFFMASPYLFFMWVPLSESLFFFFCVSIIYGIKNNKWKYIFLGILFSTLTRPIFLFFIPAFVGMSLMSQPIEKLFSRTIWEKVILNYILPCLIGLFLVVLFQYFQTGKWFIYFEIQSTVWGRAFNYGPTFPLGYNTPFWNLNGSYFSFWIGAFVSIFGLKLLMDWFRKKEVLTQIKNYELFSVIFICMSLMSILFFNASWMWNPETESSSTHFTGINRYIHPTVFLFILLIYFFKLKRFSALQYFLLFIFTHLVWFSFDLQYYNHIQRYLAFSIPTVFIIAIGLYHAYRWKFLAYVMIAASFVLQSIIFNYFLSFVQVD